MSTILMHSAIEAMVDLNDFVNRCEGHDDRREFLGAPGDQHYRLMAYLSQQFNGQEIIDIGTHRGSSALALSYNPNNKVLSFDIEDRMGDTGRATKWAGRNIEFVMGNLWDAEVRRTWLPRLLAAPLIVLDIDPHDGPMELEFYRFLKAAGYKGLLLCDDIWYFKGMRDRFWYHIPEGEKVDVTALGHWSGTGIVHFGHQSIEVFPAVPARLPAAAATAATAATAAPSWTVVTAYFDLTKRPDASAEIRARPQSYYLANANMTMALPQNLVVFCDAASYGALEALRPAHLKTRTRYIIMDFADFELVKENYDRITESRKARGYSADPRNTVSYYLFCMLRYVMLQRAMAENPFGSTHFAWCNICIERMGWKSGPAFEGVWSEFRDGFSTCYIDYQPMSLARDNWPEYFKWGRCGMCSGFYTGSKANMTAFCDAILAKFAEVTAAGYGHADEQLFSLVYFDNPAIFDFYLGDYTEMIVNYGWVRERPLEPVQNVLGHLAVSRENPALLHTLARRWLDSYELGAFEMRVPAVVETVRNYAAVPAVPAKS